MAGLIAPLTAQGVSQLMVERHTTTETVGSEQHPLIRNGDTCVVCLGAFEPGTMARTLVCTHTFHLQCIDVWLRRNKLCPICKHDIQQPLALCWGSPRDFNAGGPVARDAWPTGTPVSQLNSSTAPGAWSPGASGAMPLQDPPQAPRASVRSASLSHVAAPASPRRWDDAVQGVRSRSVPIPEATSASQIL